MSDEDTGKKLDAALSKLDTHYKSVDEVMKKTQEDIKTFGVIQDGTKDAIAKLNTDGQKLVADVTAEREKANNRMTSLEQKIAMFEKGGHDGNGKTKSVGRMFVESPEFKEFAPIGQSPASGNARSRRYEFKSITSLASSGGLALPPRYLPGVIVGPNQNLTVRDLLAPGTTDLPTIYYVKENVFTNNAGVVSEGQLKPQSDITYTNAHTNVTTIAHWIKASKQILADFSGLQSQIDARLIFGLKFKEEQELLRGDGTGMNLLGLVPQSTAYNQGSAGTDTAIDTIRRAMLQVRLSFYRASGIVLSPHDWANIELMKDTQTRYLMANPAGVLPAMLWGLPVVESDSMTNGEFLVGAFNLAAQVFDREEYSILVSTEDQDNFVRNMVTILCEERLALAVYRPAAIVHGAFPSGTSS